MKLTEHSIKAGHWFSRCVYKFFDVFEAEQVMVMHHDPEPSFQVVEKAHAHGFSHQCGHPVSPFVIQAFDHASFSAAFVTGPVLPRLEKFRIRLVKIGCPLGG